MKVIDIHNGVASCESRGVQRNVELYLVDTETLKPGDYVLVHVGYAIQKISADYAEQAVATHEQLSSFEV